MSEGKSKREKAREIVALLPKENCGKCGFENCGKLALAVAEGEESPFGCRKNPSVGYEINRVLGIATPEEIRVPAARHEFHHRSRTYPDSYRYGHPDHGIGHGKGKKGHRHSGRHYTKPWGQRIWKMLGRLVLNLCNA